MSTLTVRFFDTHEYVKKSKEMGVKEEVAEYQVAQIEKAIETAVQVVKDDIKAKDLATRGDIDIVRGELRESELKLQKEIEVVRKEIEIVRKEIAQSKNQVIIWVAGMFIASGFLQHFLK